ncbi:hypothetical protein ACFP2T_45465 [Plantactinospora solaniradicis]|uniref:DUF916 domain-containing protein n=1 Tax=Plantactinospora solaniradicis TaxID=1723736 RepID=A0ABW1KRC1_9ACTN
MTTPLRRALMVLTVATLATPVAPAVAAEPGTTVTWTVQPAGPSGPDGRRWIELTLDPGQVVTEHLAVRNFGSAAVVFSLNSADGYLTDKGRFNMLPSGQPSVDGGRWIDVREAVTVGPNETRVVPFTITVPRDAAPGDHPAGIAASVTSTGGTVNVESRVGFRVMMRASGTVRAAVAVKDVTARYRPSWNPFRGGTIRVRYLLANDGNVRASGTSRLAVTELFGLTGQDATTDVEEMLPGGSRMVESRVDPVWALGQLRTTIAVTPEPLGGDLAGAEIRQTRATVTIWALPWSQLALLLLLGVLVAGFRASARQRRRRMTQLLARAREEGRAESRARS